MSQHDIGLIGLAVMGQNLVLNMANNGFSVGVFNRTVAKTDEFLADEAKGKSIAGYRTLPELVKSLKAPRRIMMMVKAGPPVDDLIKELIPLLEKGDILIDGGNSLFSDTNRRTKDVEAAGLLYIGTGVSGGEEGALKGPSIMPGGSSSAWPSVKPLLQKISAKVGPEHDIPCCEWVGEAGSGHYVKMVHNGIEYGDMQLIAEAYEILRRALGLSAAQLSGIFTEWNQSELRSYLIEITARVLAKMDEETGSPLVDVILDEAEQKGTGKWTAQNALDIGAAVPTIDAAVYSRILSALKAERMTASQVLSIPASPYAGEPSGLIAAMRDALYVSKVLSYAQGMAMLRTASQEYDYNLALDELARIWRAGCIIRADLLNDITAAFRQERDLPNLLLASHFREVIEQRQAALRTVVITAVNIGVAAPAMSASLAYLDAYRSERLPANLIQAQRDFFGAHTYRRIDKAGVFHTRWED